MTEFDSIIILLFYYRTYRRHSAGQAKNGQTGLRLAISPNHKGYKAQKAYWHSHFSRAD